MTREVAEAIETSIREDRTVDITATSIEAVLEAIGGEWDHDEVDLGDGSHDVWGWADDTAEGQHDWRLLVTIESDA